MENNIDLQQDQADKTTGIDRIIPIFVIGYALWTLYVHALTALHASFDDLMHWLPLPAVLATAAIWRWFKLPEPTNQLQRIGADEYVAGSPWPRSFATLILAALWVTLLLLTGHYVLFWWGSIAALGAIWLASIGTTPTALRREPFNKRLLVVVIGVAVAAVLVTLVANRPDEDDSFYLSIPATLLRLPKQSVLLHDTIYRLANLPIQLPVYRMHSYEVLIGVFARVSNLSPAVIAYMVFPPIFAALSIIAWTQLLRLIAPGHWAMTLVVLFFCVLALGEAHHSYGNFAFVRLFQGKAILATLVTPCILLFALEYSCKGNMRSWLALFAVQIAAIGITSSGLFVAPAAAGIALAARWSPTAAATRRLGVGILASSYLFGVAAVLAGITDGGSGFVSSLPMPSMTRWLDENLGSWSAALLLTTLLASWAFAEGKAQARMFLSVSLCVLLTVLNPYTYRFIADHFTGTSTYWRLFWAIPLPFMLAVLLSRLLQGAIRIKSIPIALLACVTLAAGAVEFFSHAETLRAENHVTLGTPGIKVPPTEYQIAKELTLAVSEHASVLAPEGVAAWLPTFVVHPQLIAARTMYLDMPGGFSAGEAARRAALQKYVSGQEPLPHAASELGSAITHYGITSIVVITHIPWYSEIEGILSGLGWHGIDAGPYQIWTKPPTSPDKPSSAVRG